MTTKRVSPLKAQILEAVKHVKETLGYTLICDDWGNGKDKCADALACVLLTDDPASVIDGTTETIDDLVGLLEVSESWIDSFLDGFDANGVASYAKEPEGWKLGAAIRREMKPVSYLSLKVK